MASCLISLANDRTDDEALKYSIFVRNVKEGTTADALKQIFAPLGGIRNIEVKKVCVEGVDRTQQILSLK